MKNRISMAFAACACLLAAAPGQGTEPPLPDPSALVRRIEARVRSAKTLRLKLTQRYSMEGWMLRSEQAEVWCSPKAGKLRWAYAGPDAKLFILDGKRSWFYVPSEETVYASTAKEAMRANPLLAFLLRSEPLGDAYGFTHTEGTATEWVLRASPSRHEDKILPFLLYLGMLDGEAKKIAYLDQAEGLTEIFIDELALDMEIPAGSFDFTVPPGARLAEGAPGEGF
jgi:outer membrane lipoprotein-sorting protein